MPGILVDPEWLGDYIGDRRVRIVDVRDREAYTEGHIPGTVQLDLKDLLRHVPDQRIGGPDRGHPVAELTSSGFLPGFNEKICGLNSKKRRT